MDGGWSSDHGWLERVRQASYRRRTSTNGRSFLERVRQVSYRRRTSTNGSSFLEHVRSKGVTGGAPPRMAVLFLSMCAARALPAARLHEWRFFMTKNFYNGIDAGFRQPMLE